jgi:hypothetical protein
MSKHRIPSFLVIVFILTGLTSGVLMIRHEMEKGREAITSAPVREEPFQALDEALSSAPEDEADHIRQLMATDAPLDSSQPEPYQVQRVKTSPVVVTLHEEETGLVVATMSDASEELDNTLRLIDSYALLRDPSASLDSPENRAVIEQMQKNAAIRAAQAPLKLPRPQR